MAKDFEIQSEACSEFSGFVEKLSPILSELKSGTFMDINPIRKAVESLEVELRRSKAMARSSNCPSPANTQMEETIHDLARSLGLALFASRKILIDNKEKIEELRRELMGARFRSGPDSESELDNDYNDVETEQKEQTGETEKTGDIVEDEITLDIDDIVLQLKYGNDDEFRCALSEFNVLIRENSIKNDQIVEEGIIQILFNRLGSSNPSNRLAVIRTLRFLLSQSAKNKEKMADNGLLATLVKSLGWDVEEQREAVGLMLSLSEVPAVGRRIGRIQGCIVMLAAILNGDDPVGSRDAGKLLNALSSNTQNALQMAEAGYFKPLVLYLKEGSDMSKILMATALSRMELTDQSKASLGEDGAIDPLVKMFNRGKLEAKFSALRALQNLSSLKENIQRLINSGMVISLLQLLFSVTSVLMTLREPASAILARIAQSESVLVNQDIAQPMLSLLNLSSPVIQNHLLQALNGIAAHPSTAKVRREMKENGAIQLLFPFLTEPNTKIRTGALNLIHTLTRHFPEELTEQLGESHLNIVINIIASALSERERAAAIGIVSNIPVGDKKATDMLKKANLLPILVSITNSIPDISSPDSCSLAESIAGVFVRFTAPSDKKLQQFSAEQGVIPLLVKLLSNGSAVAQCRAATSLAQLSRSSLSLKKSRTTRWLCVPPSADAFCEVHDGYCSVKGTFCLIKAGAISPLVQILDGSKREADEAVLGALATLLQDEIWENGSNCIVKESGAQSVIKVLEKGTVKAQEKALRILERIFRVEAHRVAYGEFAEAVLVDLAQKGDPSLKPIVAPLLAQLELLQHQSCYF